MKSLPPLHIRLFRILTVVVFAITLVVGLPLTSFEMITTYVVSESYPDEVRTFPFQVFSEPLIPFLASLALLVVSAILVSSPK